MLDLFWDHARFDLPYFALAGERTSISCEHLPLQSQANPTATGRWCTSAVACSSAGSAVLRDINLDVPRGQTLAIIGESGCGKTVL